MCLAIPALVVELDTDALSAVVDLDGVRKRVSIALLPDARVGDYLIIHVGHAIGMVDPGEAARTLAEFGALSKLAGSAAEARGEAA